MKSFAQILFLFFIPAAAFGQNLTVETGYKSGSLSHIHESQIAEDAKFDEWDFSVNSKHLAMMGAFSGGSYSDPYYRVRYDHWLGKHEFSFGWRYSKKETDFQSQEYFQTVNERFIGESAPVDYTGLRNHAFSFYVQSDYEVFAGMKFGFLFQRLFLTPGIGVRGMRVEYFRGRDSYAQGSVFGQNGISMDQRPANRSDFENSYKSRSAGGLLYFETLYRASKRFWLGHTISAFGMSGPSRRGEIYGTFGRYGDGAYTEFATVYERGTSNISTSGIRNTVFLEYSFTYSFRFTLGAESEMFQTGYSGFSHEFSAFNYYFINNASNTFINNGGRSVFLNPEYITDGIAWGKKNSHGNSAVFGGFKLIINLSSN